ncbi:ThiF family adenylyltransferase [Bradyrhizobium erythrophlei]|jgi:integrative and conjugative element protein (TIGR02256 family)|uniref:Integrative and conjugative element protein, VC0181 family n=1 Tax=Bradyrhizobium erythrophlei TaxID=1437360 RepID=A0A1M5SU62_9BRAD|nr:ThiF family adenylyltransferase [Bradyrhizobium erythrophlei]SHH42081.1 integrative and conjugative element protein, VC0181 family [Bradyrhizobium erythrophlei]
MLHQWLGQWGEVCDPPDLQIPLASQLVRLLSTHGAGVAEILGARRAGRAEVLVLDVQTARPQRPAYPLNRSEPIAILFPQEGAAPIVLALRTDFPDTPHQNWVPEQIPACLCVDDRPWVEARLTYTAGQLLFRILNWFKLAGMGELHETGRALDPYFTGVTFEIILPASVFTEVPADKANLVGFIQAGKRHPVIIAETYSPERHGSIAAGGIVMTTYAIPPQNMRRLRHVPTTLDELVRELREHGIDLVADLGGKIDGWAGVQQRDVFRLTSRLAVVLKVPVIDPASGTVTRTDNLAFVTNQSLGEVGVALGRLLENRSDVGNQQGFVRQIVPVVPVPDRLASIALCTAAVHVEFNAEMAAAMSGLAAPDGRKAVMVGAGSIGSNLSEALVREGRFDWTVVDKDYLLPHNLARHTLTLQSSGAFKADHVAARLRTLRSGVSCKAIVADFLDDHDDELTESLRAADIIIDTSASVPVARAIADLEVDARRASAFFNPAGTAAVLLVQDRDGKVDLRALEAAYYAQILTKEVLADHLSQSANAIPYAGACRSVTNRIPAARAITLSGLAATGLSKAIDRDEALVQIWSLAESGAVEVCVRHVVPPRLHASLWQIFVDPEVERRLKCMRAERLPNETGGVLMGVVDVAAKRIDVVDAWDQPPDSRGSASLFERGTGGLKRRVFDAMERTLDQVRYVGEWHSHPRHHSTNPSDIDVAQIAWLTDSLASDGCPALMIIVGDDDIRVCMGTTLEALKADLSK